MDMKRILQALDSASTKPVEGANEMSRFLRAVTEADINQPSEPTDPNYKRYAELMAKYDMLAKELLPDNSGIEKGASPDAIAEINKIKTMAAQLAGPNLQAWEQARTASNAASMAQAQANQPALAAQLEENNDIAKFLSIVTNDNKLLSESATPHKVSLPVQMAMQHYQKITQSVSGKDSLLKKYFIEAEEKILQESVERTERINKKAKEIANRIAEKKNKN